MDTRKFGLGAGLNDVGGSELHEEALRWAGIKRRDAGPSVLLFPRQTPQQLIRTLKFD